MDTGELLTLLLGGGAVATFSALFTGIKSLQTGARARERETVASLVAQRKEAWEDKNFADDVADYWRVWAGTVEYEARRNGVELPQRPPEPVKPEPIKPEEES